MRTRNERGEVYGPVRLLEMLELRFGAFETIAYAAMELARKKPDANPPMDVKTADAILEFADDLRQAYGAAVEWASSR
jgi:hypothetical protein